MISAFIDHDRFGLAHEFNQDECMAVILNNTAALHMHRHFGPNHVISTICSGLKENGVQPVGWANGWQGLARLLSRLQRVPDIVVLNGEGTLHHDNERAVSLLAMANTLKQLGARAVLINSVWEANTNLSNSLLKCFDVISVRESHSLRQISKIRPDAVGVPDLGFVSFPTKPEKKPAHNNWGIIDAAIPQSATALLDFAHANTMEYFVMEERPRIFRRHFKAQKLPEKQPVVLRELDLQAHPFWITGRFHGALALMAAQIPFAALHTNTYKMAGMLEDAGLSKALLPQGWFQLPENGKMELINQVHKSWDKTMKQKISSYREHAISRSTELFKQICTP